MNLNIQVIDRSDDLPYALELLKNCPKPLFGLDTETTVGRAQNDQEPPNLVSTVQIGTADRCFIIQVYRLYMLEGKIPPSLVRFLENPHYLKVGVDLTTDAERLYDSYQIRLRGQIDLQALARSFGQPFSSLQDLAQYYLKDDNEHLVGLNKGDLAHISDWDAPVLNQACQIYAANDTLIPLQVYQKMLQGVQANNSEDLQATQAPPDPSQDIQLMAWLRANVKGKIESYGQQSCYLRTKASVVQQIVNSYGPWRNRYPTAERTRHAEAVLERLVEAGQLDRQAATGNNKLIFPCPISSNSQQTKFTPELVAQLASQLSDDAFQSLLFLREVTPSDSPGKSLSALTNQLINSCGHLVRHYSRLSKRQHQAESVLSELLQAECLKRELNGRYYIAS